MDLQDATLDDVEAVVVAKLLEGVGFVSVHLERHALIVAPTFRSRSHRAACLLGGGASAHQRRQPARDTGASTAVRTATTRNTASHYAILNCHNRTVRRTGPGS